MVLEISQETFDNAVQENIELLGLSEEEAIKETVQQFEAQGVDLSKIITEYMSSREFEEISDAIKKLEQLAKTKGSVDTLIETLEILKVECEKGLQHKVTAGKHGAYTILLDTYKTFSDKNVRSQCLKTLVVLMTKQPDLLDARGVEFMINNLKDTFQDFELQRLTLKWVKECCVMHEVNRQKIFEANILSILKENIKEQSPIEVIRETLSVCRALVLDDDVRVEFGRAHEHARVIASETLCSIMTLLSKFRGEEQLNFDIILTITSLLVRTEFCKKVEDAGGLELIRGVMESFRRNDKIIRQCFKLIKALAGNDECKVHMIQKHFAPVLNHSINASLENAATITAALSCIAAITLRSPENSKVLFDEGIPEVIVTAMNQHSDQKQVQKSASWAIRNMVSRSKYQTKKFLELGIEEILQKDLKKFKDIEYDIKSALRDLGCKVNLKEEWTGKGGALTTGVDFD